MKLSGTCRDVRVARRYTGRWAIKLQVLQTTLRKKVCLITFPVVLLRLRLLL